MNIPYYKLDSLALRRIALLANLGTAWLVYQGTHNIWLALASHQLGLMAAMLHCSTLMYLGEQQQKAEDAALDHHKVAMPEPRRETGDRFAAPHPRLSASGYALPQILGFIACLLGALLFIPVIAFIVFTLFGAQEPRW